MLGERLFITNNKNLLVRPFRYISVGHMLGNDSRHYLGGLEIKFPKGIVKIDLQDPGWTCQGRGSVRLGLSLAKPQGEGS